MSAPDAATLLARAHGLLPSILAQADAIDAERQLPAPLLEQLAGAGFYAMLLPRPLGGSDVDILTYLRVSETLARADAATAWLVMHGANSARRFAAMDQDVARGLLARYRHPLAAGMSTPLGRAVVTEGGYRLSGRWPFISGSRHAHWFGAGSTVYEPDGRPRLGPNSAPVTTTLTVPFEQCTIIDTWHTLGMRGSNSNDVAVEGVFVPYEHAPLDGRVPTTTLDRLAGVILIAGTAAVALGVARTAVDTLLDLGRTKKPRATGALLRERPSAQAQAGRAEAAVAAARALLYETTEAAQARAEAGEVIGGELATRVRLATTHAVAAAVEAINLAFDASGTSGTFKGSPLERAFRDIHTLKHHHFVSAANFETVGRALFEAEPAAMPGGAGP